jgi:hypothetical protein
MPGGEQVAGRARVRLGRLTAWLTAEPGCPLRYSYDTITYAWEACAGARVPRELVSPNADGMSGSVFGRCRRPGRSLFINRLDTSTITCTILFIFTLGRHFSCLFTILLLSWRYLDGIYDDGTPVVPPHRTVRQSDKSGGGCIDSSPAALIKRALHGSWSAIVVAFSGCPRVTTTG